MGADAVAASGLAASSEDHIRRNATPWQSVQHQFQRWTGFGVVSIAELAAAEQPDTAEKARQTRFAAWSRHALERVATAAVDFEDGEELERTGRAEGQLSAKALAAQKPYDAREYAAQRAAAWEKAITE